MKPIEDAILDTFFAIMDKRLAKGKETFDADEIITDIETDGNLDLKNEQPNTLQLILKSWLTPKLRMLLEKILRDPEARKELVEILTKQLLPKATLHLIIGTLSKALSYEGPELVLREVLPKVSAQLRHDYVRTIEKTNSYAMELLSTPRPRYRPRMEPKPD